MAMRLFAAMDESVRSTRSLMSRSDSEKDDPFRLRSSKRWSSSRSTLADDADYPSLDSEDAGCDSDLDPVEYADSMEKGLARETVRAELLLPLPSPSSSATAKAAAKEGSGSGGRLHRHTVARSEDEREYRLFSDDLDLLLYARLAPPAAGAAARGANAARARAIDIFCYDPQDESAQALDSTRPAFSLTSDDGGASWRLVRNRCEHCRFSPKHLSCLCHGKQQVAYIRRFSQKLGSGVSTSMEVKIPGLRSDGSPVVWCPRLGAPDFAEAPTLRSKLPTWNEEFQCLILDFEDRSVSASPTNFQLALPDAPDKVVCQYGQIGTNMFGLDFQGPLSVVQAFAVALATAGSSTGAAPSPSAAAQARR